ncbi:MAG: histidine kinase [Proteobacteria bacterium]|nr:histidine kinase [Pseudomonadota bacterium]
MKVIYGIIFKIRFVILIISLIILTSAMPAIYTLKGFKDFSMLEIEHQGLLVAHALSAGIVTYTDIDNIKGIQERIDRFSEARENDVEINIMFVDGHTSRIVASNIKENIAETSPEEHENLLASLKYGKPVILIGDETGDDENSPENGTENTDNDTRSEIFDFHHKRFLSITVPIVLEGNGIGSINVKVSLADLYEKIGAIKQSIILVIAMGLLLLVSGLWVLTNLLLNENSRLMAEETTRIQAELKALQSQVNPHFLFNTLNSLSSLISDDPALAEELTLEMAGLYRKILGAGMKGWWTVNDEIELIRSYLKIESVRLRDRLKFSIDLAPFAETIRIPCLIIEPLVENAVKHGINQSIQGGEIAIDIILNGDLLIRVEDTLFVSEAYPLSSGALGEQSGIRNISKRLDLVYGEDAAITFDMSRQGTGAVSTIIIKNIGKYQNDNIQGHFS